MLPNFADERKRWPGKKPPQLSEKVKALSPEDIRQTFHELQVHQIELEMQNEELRRTHVELDATRAKYFDLYDQAPVGYVIVNEKGLILEANLTAATFLNLARVTMVRQPFTRYIFKDDQDVYYLHRKRLLETDTPQACEFRMLRTGADPFWVRLEATTAKDADGKSVYRFVISEVTDRKRAEDSLRGLMETQENRIAERTQELESANASLKQNETQLRNLAVELMQAEDRERKRLAVILHDHLQQFLVAAKFKVAAIQRHTLDANHARTFRDVLDLLGEAIDASRSLTTDLYPPVFQDGSLLTGLCWLGHRMKENYELTVDVTGQDVLGIPEPLDILLFQAVRELLLNVVKHAGVNHVSVDVSQADAASLRVVVTDRGVGFAENSSENFGLFHLRKRLSSLGGSLDVVSVPGQGTQVSVTVPFESSTKKSPVSVKPGKSLKPASLSKTKPVIRHLVVVDDHMVLRQGLIELLRKEADIAVIGVASNGVEAIHVARNLKPDIILMDISMPIMNGIDATRIITGEMPETQIIGLSVHEPGKMSSRILEAGAASYLPKDGPIENLIAAIHAIPLTDKKVS
jgi:PAS domain S-box-containing protein